MSQNIKQSRLSLVFYAGFDGEWKEILKTKNFSNIEITATGTQLKNTAENERLTKITRPVIISNGAGDFIHL